MRIQLDYLSNLIAMTGQADLDARRFRSPTNLIIGIKKRTHSATRTHLLARDFPSSRVSSFSGRKDNAPPLFVLGYVNAPPSPRTTAC